MQLVDVFFNDGKTAALFAVYMAALGAAAVTVVRRLPVFNRAAGGGAAVAVLQLLSPVALALTWFKILSFIAEDAAQYADAASYAASDNLFVAAYELVSRGGWWSSAQLLVWVAPACLYLQQHVRDGATQRNANDGASITRGDALAHSGLAFLGAVSASFPLLFARLLASPAPDARRRSDSATPVATWTQLACTALALGSVVLLPLTVDRSAWRAAYIAALALLHVVLVVPLLTSRGATTSDAAARSDDVPLRNGVPLRDVYLMLAGAAAALHVSYCAAFALRGDELASPAAFLAAAYSNLCQQSISLDVWFTGAASGVLFVARRGWAGGAPLAALQPLLGVGACFALFAAAELPSAAKRRD